MKMIVKVLSAIMTISLLFQSHLMANSIPNTLTEDVLKISDYNISNKKISNDLKIVHLSDYHNEAYQVNDTQLIDEIKKQQPNIIVLTGDMLDSEVLQIDYTKIKENNSVKFLNTISEIAPTYYILGNNEAFSKEQWDLISKSLSKVTIINDDYLTISINNEKINLIGLTDVSVLPKSNKSANTIIEEKLKMILKKTNNNYYNILLVHRPDYLPIISKYAIDLTLSGHTHGGQVLINKKPIILPNKNCPYIQGLYKEKNTTLIVNQGLGTSGIKLRADCPPEIGVIHLNNIITNK